MRHAADEPAAVFAKHLQVSARPAQALVPALHELRGLLVVEHRFFAVAYLPAAGDALDGELDVLREQEEVPAAALVDRPAGEEEARAGDGRAGAQQRAAAVEELRLAQEPQRVAGGDPVVAVVFRVAVAGDDLVAVGEGAVHLRDVALLQHVVGVKDEIAVEGLVRVALVYTLHQPGKGVALAYPRGVEPLENDGPVLARHARRIVRAVVRHDENRDAPPVVGLPGDAVQQVADDGLLVPRRDEHGIVVRLLLLVRLRLLQDRDEDVQELIAVAKYEYHRDDVVDNIQCVHRDASLCVWAHNTRRNLKLQGYFL